MSCPETNNDPHRLRQAWINMDATMVEAGERSARRLAEEIERLTIGSIGQNEEKEDG